MKFFHFKKEDILWWLGLITFWFVARFLFALPQFIRKSIIPSLRDYSDYLIEGVIASSIAVIVISIFRDVKDEVTEKRVFGIKFVWHRKYMWHWIGMTMLFGIGRSFFNLYHNISPHILLNFIKGGVIFAIVYIGAAFWEGNPDFFEGHYKEDKEKNK